ncbi:MAG: RDD family protein [Actinobacteria bacterium]|nr:RDD family protein [Actinomycetota bacterium]
MDRVFGAIVPRAVDALDPDELIERLDLDQVIARLDLDAALARIDVDALIARIDVNALIAGVDVDGMVRGVDVDGLIQRVDVDALVQRVDVDALIQRVDVDALMQRVDVDALMARVDISALMTRVDLDAVLAQVDIPLLVARAGIDQIVRDATTGLAARTLDLARRQVLGIDVVALGLVDKALRRRPLEVVGADGERPVPQGRPAGPLGRLIGFVIDSVVVSTLFGLGVSLAASLWELFFDTSFDPSRNEGSPWLIGFGAWWFVYLWISLSVAGRTLGKGIVGLRVVAADGGPLGPGRAALRVLAFPFSFVLGLGFVPAILGRNRRALHDYVAGSREIVDWGARDASLPAPLTQWIEARS